VRRTSADVRTRPGAQATVGQRIVVGRGNPFIQGFIRARTIYIMLTAMRAIVIPHDFDSPLGPIGERTADHRYKSC